MVKMLIETILFILFCIIFITIIITIFSLCLTPVLWWIEKIIYPMWDKALDNKKSKKSKRKCKRK